ncbi:hypothetical protein D6817_05395 [Candidatus Pacearchaeota archaeon]|nr:MAG: hypothetical protein D6817_05395 [Candidatus Pacearchaeota archaeon]
MARVWRFARVEVARSSYLAAETAQFNEVAEGQRERFWKMRPDGKRERSAVSENEFRRTSPGLLIALSHYRTQNNSYVQ